MKSKRSSDSTFKAIRNRNRSIDYQQFEERRLLAGDLIGQPTLLDQLAQREDTAWTQRGLNQLEEVSSETSENGTTTLFQQVWNGLPVFNSFVTVGQDVDGNITDVRNNAQQNIEGYARDFDPISELLATQIASEGLGRGVELQSEASRAWYYTGNSVRLSWLVETAVLDSDGEVASEYDTWVDVFGGSIFHSEASGESFAAQLEDPFSETGVFPRIVINDAIGPQGSRDFASPFDSVVSISVGCTGTLIAPDTVISARHCGIGAGDSVTFGDNSSGAGASTFGVASALNPSGGNANSDLLDGGDVTIVTLTSNVPASVATPTRFIDAGADLVGLTAVTVGYGFNGVGSSGHGNSADGFRWGGENIIDVYGAPAGANGSNIISTDFDDGSNAANTIGGSDTTPLEFEATTAPGDSGGPILVNVAGEWVIAGVLSGGTTANSVYGDISWWTGTTIYRDAIEDAGGTFVGNEAGSVRFDSESYFVGDSVDVRIQDGNAVGDVTATLTSTSGDSETITISASSNGIYNGAINTSGSSVSQNDGVLQVADGDQITVTYIDADDGTGSSATQTDTANIFDLSLIHI